MMPIITSDEMERVFRISYKNQSGTCFLHENGNGSFFVSAKHVLDGLVAGEMVTLQRADGSHHGVVVSGCWMAPQNIDICTFSAKNFYVPDPLNIHKAKDNNISHGDQLLFLGFPHELINTVPSRAGFSSPLVKGALFSGAIEENGVNTMILDGINNPGFSGGPVFKSGIKNRSVLVGIISGYIIESLNHSAVFKTIAGIETPKMGMYVKANSGMILAFASGHLDNLSKNVDVFNPKQKQ